MSREKRIKEQLTEAFSPTHLDIQNDSHKHHSHYSGDGESHFRITVSSPAFEKLSKVMAHRKINALLKEEFESGLHALQLSIIP